MWWDEVLGGLLVICLTAGIFAALFVGLSVLVKLMERDAIPNGARRRRHGRHIP